MPIQTACGLFGHCRQAYYQLKTSYFERSSRENRWIESAKSIREIAPGVGSVKLHKQLTDIFGVNHMIGRDAFIALLHKHRMVLKAPKTRCTTNSNHRFRKYKNLIKGIELSSSNQLWVADITYLESQDGVAYLHIITDAYSRRIMGWKLSTSLKAEHTLDALRKAIYYAGEDNLLNLIHHSDRGVQYCSSDYVNLLKSYGISISMTQDSKPTDNAIAERVNGIVKQELFYKQKLAKSIKELEYRIHTYINYYNSRRPHMSLDMQTPNQAYQQSGLQKRVWKPKIFKKYEQEVTEP